MSLPIHQQLKELRETKSISLEQAAQATRIRLHYLKALEAGNFSALPSPAQARGFVRSYAAYLGLDPQAVIEALVAEVPGSLAASSRPLPPAQAAPDMSSEEADRLFKEIGEKLQNQRQLLDLALEDVELHTHIRIFYLQALEAGRFGDLPSPVQGRGMLNNYASFLGMDAEPLLLRFAEALQARLNVKQALDPPRRPIAIRRDWSQKNLFQRLLSPDFIIGGLIIIFLTGFTIWGSLRISSLRSDSARQTATQTAALSLQAAALNSGLTSSPGGTRTTTPTPDGEDPAGLPTLPADLPGDEEDPDLAPGALPAPSSAVQVYVVVKQRTWMRVLIDDKVEFEGRVIPGGAYLYDGDRSIEILAGSGAALQVFFNQVDQGLLGTFGEVVNRIYTSEGILTPTPTLTPTGRPAPTATPTPMGMEATTASPTATAPLPPLP
jgi:cytoskeleton protein RodZ